LKSSRGLKALNIYPDDIRLRSLLAESYLEGGFIGQAEAEMDIITSDIDNLVSAYRVQAEIYLRQQRTEEALQAMKRFLAVRPNDQEALDLLNRIKPPEQEVITELTEEEQLSETQGIPEEPALAIVEEGDEKPELVTSTLAEMYYYQGQIEEAISTYEKVVLNNPGDKASTVRLSEIRALTADETGTPDIGGQDSTAKTQRMMSVLEGWLDKIHELKNVQ
jgi:tetratricopeptide (TPR) repeat protein